MDHANGPKYPKKLMQSKFVRSQTKVLDINEGRIHAVVSSETRDRDGDVIRANGWELDRFLEHPVLVSSHDYGRLSSVIGEWETMTINGKQLEGVARYYIGQGNPEADWGFNLASKGRAAYSVGFIPDMTKAKELPGTRGFGGYEFNKQELLEVSHVTIPSNPDALQQLKAFASHPIVKELIDEELESAGQFREEISDEWIARVAEKLGPIIADLLLSEMEDQIMVLAPDKYTLKMQGDDDEEEAAEESAEESSDDSDDGEEASEDDGESEPEAVLAHIDSIIEKVLREGASR